MVKPWLTPDNSRYSDLQDDVPSWYSCDEEGLILSSIRRQGHEKTVKDTVGEEDTRTSLRDHRDRGSPGIISSGPH